MIAQLILWFRGLSLARLSAVFAKEMVQMRRDRLTFAIMVGMPIMQLLLFGYAINTDPRHMPTVIERREDGPLSRAFVAAMKASTYFKIIAETTSAAQSDRLMRSGRATFIIVIPEGFEREFVRGARPQILLAADATDPVAAAGAVGAVDKIALSAFARDLQGPLARLAPADPPWEIVVHKRFNPAGITAYNIVPALLGIILTMTMVMITSMALTREAERGTMETLLATPLTPLEVMIGKTGPYLLVAFLQTALVLVMAVLLFHVPIMGSFAAFLLGHALFVTCNLALGFTISTFARSQMQAMQMTLFTFLPSILLSGFMFPFYAMPRWAQAIGECLPVTHFIRVVRQAMLKGASPFELAQEYAALAVILAVLVGAALMRFRRTLD